MHKNHDEEVLILIISLANISLSLYSFPSDEKMKEL